MTEERSGESQRSAVTPPPNSGDQQPSLPEEQPSQLAGDEEKEEKSPPYNLWFAWSALGVGLLAFALTILIFGDKLDAAAATAALGALFTLIGTVAGAYFGVKSSSDTADRAKKQVDKATARTERANRSAKAALLEVDPTKSAEFRARGLL